MYSYRADTHKYRWRKYAAAALYALFLLAESGEFFVSSNEKIRLDSHSAETYNSVETPEHLPENPAGKTLAIRNFCFSLNKKTSKAPYTPLPSSKSGCIEILSTSDEISDFHVQLARLPIDNTIFKRVF